MSLFLEDKLFHAVKSHIQYCNIKANNSFEYDIIEQKLMCEEILKKLEGIFVARTILSRNELETRMPKHDFSYSPTYFSGNKNTISLSKHKNVKTEYVCEDCNMFGIKAVYYYDKELGYWLKNFKTYDAEDAFCTFVCCGPSLIFDNAVLDKCIKGKYPVMEHEILLKDELSLDNLVAIGFPIWNTALAQPYFGLDEPDEKHFSKLEYVKYDFLRNLINLMKKYNINVPLVSVEDGIEFKENKEFTRKLERRFNKNNE